MTNNFYNISDYLTVIYHNFDDSGANSSVSLDVSFSAQQYLNDTSS